MRAAVAPLVVLAARGVARAWCVSALAALTIGLASCAPKPAPIAPGPPRYPEFLYPVVPRDLARAAQAAPHDLAWRALQSGDARRAAREFDVLLRTNPAFYPAQAGAGYAALAMKDYEQSVTFFARAMARAPKYVPAIVGRGEALLGLDRQDDALKDFDLALSIEPNLPDVQRRVEVLRFRGLEGQLAEARSARRRGRIDEARAAYARSLELSPDSPLVYRELAELERGAGDLAVALEHARRALALDPNDGAAALLVAEILEARGELDAAIDAYLAAQALDAAPDLAERIDGIRRKLALAQLPQQYRELPGAARATRGDLAALIGLRLEAVVRAARAKGTGLVTDARGHWAAAWITAVARAGIMDPLPNHTFQPRSVVRRGELAQVTTRVLAIVGARDKALAASWAGRRLSFSDLGAGHVMHGAASTAVAAGVLGKVDGEAFAPSRVTSGAEIIAAVDRLEELAVRAGFPRSTGAALR
jgi:tetratricopeptide (TPR) repeat protein